MKQRIFDAAIFISTMRNRPWCTALCWVVAAATGIRATIEISAGRPTEAIWCVVGIVVLALERTISACIHHLKSTKMAKTAKAVATQ